MRCRFWRLPQEKEKRSGHQSADINRLMRPGREAGTPAKWKCHCLREGSRAYPSVPAGQRGAHSEDSNTASPTSQDNCISLIQAKSKSSQCVTKSARVHWRVSSIKVTFCNLHVAPWESSCFQPFTGSLPPPTATPENTHASAGKPGKGRHLAGLGCRLPVGVTCRAKWTTSGALHNS